MTSTHCPSPEDFARSVSLGGDATLVEHLTTCATCAPEWEGATRLRALARALPFDRPEPVVVDAVRARVLAAVRAKERQRRRVSAVVASGFALAAAAMAVLAVRHYDARETAVTYHATLTARGNVLFSRDSAAPYERVSLRAGTLHVEVRPLHAGERFVVEAGDGQVEVRGTAFDVSVVAGHLSNVHVEHGRVEVRPAGAPTVLLGPGDAWPTTVSSQPSEVLAPTTSVPSAATPTLGIPESAVPAVVHRTASGLTTAPTAPVTAPVGGSPSSNSEPSELGPAPAVSAPPPPPLVPTPPPALPAVPVMSSSPNSSQNHERNRDEEKRERRDDRRERSDQRRLR
jgi:hypothetical protein